MRVEPPCGVSALMRGDEDSSSLATVGGYDEKPAVCDPGGGPRRTQSCRCLVSDFKLSQLREVDVYR